MFSDRRSTIAGLDYLHRHVLTPGLDRRWVITVAAEIVQRGLLDCEHAEHVVQSLWMDRCDPWPADLNYAERIRLAQLQTDLQRLGLADRRTL